MDKKKAYHILNINKNEYVDKEILRKKYFKAALNHHPDKNKNSELFLDVKEAYEYLLEDINTISPLFYLNEEYTHTLFILLKQYVYKPFEQHINSYKIYELNPKLDKLFNKELYYMSEYDIYIPLWYHELWYEDKKIKIKIKPSLPDYITIDIYNNIHIYLENKTKTIGDTIEINIGCKSFSFLYETNELNEIVLYNKGIPIIKEKIFEYNELSNIIIHFT